MNRRALLVTSAIAAAATGGVIVGLGDGRAVAISSLPRATGFPDCGEGRGVGTHHMDYVAGSGFGTPTEALASALETGMNGYSAAEYSGRAVRAQGELAYEFILRQPDGSLQSMASVTQVDDERWLISVMYQCFTP